MFQSPAPDKNLFVQYRESWEVDIIVFCRDSFCSFCLDPGNWSMFSFERIFLFFDNLFECLGFLLSTAFLVRLLKLPEYCFTRLDEVWWFELVDVLRLTLSSKLILRESFFGPSRSRLFLLLKVINNHYKIFLLHQLTCWLSCRGQHQLVWTVLSSSSSDPRDFSHCPLQQSWAEDESLYHCPPKLLVEWRLEWNYLIILLYTNKAPVSEMREQQGRVWLLCLISFSWKHNFTITRADSVLKSQQQRKWILLTDMSSGAWRTDLNELLPSFNS